MAYASLVTSDDFDILPYALPNLEEVQDTFDEFVVEQQELILRKILGDSLFEAYEGGVDDEARYTNLRDGEDYTYNGHTYKWKGLAALLKPYIFSQWLKYNADSVSEVGVVVAEVENSNGVSPAARIARAYNAFADLCGNYCDKEDTLYGYLSVSVNTFIDVIDGYTITEYLDRKFPDLGSMNQFGI